jgi:hypothetical protein
LDDRRKVYHVAQCLVDYAVEWDGFRITAWALFPVGHHAAIKVWAECGLIELYVTDGAQMIHWVPFLT